MQVHLIAWGRGCLILVGILCTAYFECQNVYRILTCEKVPKNSFLLVLFFILKNKYSSSNYLRLFNQQL